MGWFLAQSWLFLSAAFALGLLVGWLWWARHRAPAPGPSGAGPAQVPADVKAVADQADAALAERDEAVAARQDALAALGEAVAERDAARQQRDDATAERDAAVAERDQAAEEHRLEVAGKNAALAGRDTEVQRLRALTAAGDGEIQRLRALTTVTASPRAVGADRATADGHVGPAGGPARTPAKTSPTNSPAPAGGTDHTDPDGDDTDDLQRIEGIGPKIASVLAADGVHTYRRLAGLDEDDLRRILTGAGVTFAPSVTTWPQQARLLADGDHGGHAALTATLTAGRPTSGPLPVLSTTEEDDRDDRPAPDGAPAQAEPRVDPEPEDDLERIEGVGPRIAAALRAARIRTFRRLAEADVVELQAALEASGLRFAPSLPTWSRQAMFLADGDQVGFEALTDSLVAGRERGGRN